MKDYYVYIMTNKTNTTLYIGVTGNLEKRLYKHQHKLLPGFTQRYNLTKLVYTESCPDPLDAITREKQLPKNNFWGWKRDKKNALISSVNPDWMDLSADWYGGASPETA